MRILVPYYRDLLRPGAYYSPSAWPTQVVIPRDARLLQKLRIKKGSKVLVVAGCSADWAAALADSGAKVKYTDVSKIMTDYAKTRFGERGRKRKGVARFVSSIKRIFEKPKPKMVFI